MPTKVKPNAMSVAQSPEAALGACESEQPPSSEPDDFDLAVSAVEPLVVPALTMPPAEAPPELLLGVPPAALPLVLLAPPPACAPPASFA
jgi:hypothetical protein